MEWFANWTRKGRQPSPEDIRLAQVEAIAHALNDILVPQIELLGYEPGAVPMEGKTGSERSRGYVLGVVGGIMGQLATYRPEWDLQKEGLIAAFRLVYGECATPAIIRETAQRYHDGDKSVSAGVLIGEADAASAGLGEELVHRTGFLSMNIG